MNRPPMTRFRQKELLRGPPNPDNDFRDELNKQCALAMVGWLKASVNISRAIKTLNIDEMKGLAEAATSTWICAVSKRLLEAPETPDQEYLSALIV